MPSIQQLKEALRAKPKPKRIPSKNLLSTGSTLVNLACSGRSAGAFYKGGYFLIVGDSDSGKSFISMTCLGQAAKSKRFKNYRFIHDNAEGGVLMDIAHFFGADVESRLEEPDRGISEYVEDFYSNLDAAYNRDEPFIYILDSMDVLEAKADAKKAKAARRAADKGQEIAGSYGTEKAKQNSAGLRKARKMLKKNGSILIIISQTRDNIGFGAKFNPRTRSGGRALKFFARLELWLSSVGNITKTVRGKNRQLGIRSKIQVQKNHITGKKGSVEIPIYHSYGIDDLGSCVDYLIDEGHWTKRKSTIKAPEFDFEGKVEKLIRHIEENNLEKELQEIVSNVWTEIEDACTLRRNPRYV